MTIAEGFSIAKDVVLILAAGTGMFVGLKGLNACRRQLDGHAKFELARSILASVYEVRSAINRARVPLMSFPEEPDLPAERLATMGRDEKTWYARSQGFKARLDPVVEAHSRLEERLWEAEAVFDDSVPKKAQALTSLVNDLVWAVQEHLESTDPTEVDPHAPKEDAVLVKERRRIMFSGRKDDRFRDEMESAVAEIVKLLKPHIRGS